MIGLWGRDPGKFCRLDGGQERQTWKREARARLGSTPYISVSKHGEPMILVRSLFFIPIVTLHKGKLRLYNIERKKRVLRIRVMRRRKTAIFLKDLKSRLCRAVRA